MFLVQMVAYGICFYLLILLFFYIFQEKFLFFPPKSPQGVVRDVAVQPFAFAREKVVLHGWLLHPQKAKDRLLVYFGGNGEDISMAMDDFLQVDSATLLVAYRGYGTSDGNPGQEQLYGDGLALVEEAKRRFSPKWLVVLGRSLGSAVATYVAANTSVDQLVLVTPFDSIKAIGKRRFPWLPVGLLLKHPFDSASYAKLVVAPVLVIHAGEDRVVPEAHTLRLMDSFTNRPESLRIDKADHNTVEMYPQYWQALLAVLYPPEK